MKVLFLINEFGRGGAERVVSYLLNHLPTISPELIPVLYTLEESEIAYPIPDNIELVIGSKFHSSNIIKFIKIPLLAMRLKCFIKKNNIKIVISFLSRANYTNIIATYLGSNHHCILSERNTASLIYKSSRITDIINRFFIRNLYPSCQSIIAVSNGVKNDLVENFSIPEDKVVVIYNPYDIDDIKLKSQEVVKHKWLDNQEYQTIITVGHLEKPKNYILLIKAYKKAIEELPNLRLIIIGEGSEKDKLTYSVSKLDLTNKIDFTGKLENPFSYVSRADLFVLSSDTEGFPNVLVEAMVCGCPVISTDCKSGPNEIIMHNQNGYLVPVGDINALSKTIISLILDKQLCRELTIKARETVKDFELTKIVNQYMQKLSQYLQ